MTEKIFYISGCVKNREKKAVPNLRVEAWDKDLIVENFVADAVTKPDGHSHIEITEERFKELFLDRRTDLYFMVRKCRHITDEVIADTSYSILWNIESGVAEIPDIEVDLTVEGEPQPEVPHRLESRLLHEETGEALAGFIVWSFDLDASQEFMYLGYDIANSQVLFVVFYTTPEQPETSDGEEQKRKLQFVILKPGGDQIYETDVEIVVNSNLVLEIKVPAEELPQPVTYLLNEVVAILDLDIPKTLLPFLSENDIYTLEDIRCSAGVGNLEGLLRYKTWVVYLHSGKEGRPISRADRESEYWFQDYRKMLTKLGTS